MSQFPDHGINDPDIGVTDAQVLTPAEALLAGTLALTTGQAQVCCERQRALMAKKIVANLFMLSIFTACFGTQPRRPFNERSPSNPDAA